MKDRPADFMGLSIKDEGDNESSLVSDAVVDGGIDVLSMVDDFSTNSRLNLLLLLLRRGFAIAVRRLP